MTDKQLPKPAKAMPAGQRLNQFDVNLAEKGILKDLPSSSRSLNALRHQLETDIALLRLELVDLDRVQDEKVREQSVGLHREREAYLLSKLCDVDAELSKINPFQRMGTFTWRDLKHLLGATVFSALWSQDKSRHMPKEKTLEDYCDELTSLQKILEEYLHDSTKLDPQRMSALVSQFDRQVRVAERLARGMKPANKGL